LIEPAKQSSNQTQGWAENKGETMTQKKPWIGVDVAKDSLKVHVRPTNERWETTTTMAELKKAGEET